MTQKTFHECVTMLQATFGKAEDLRIKGLWMILENEMDDAEFKAATTRIMKTFRPTSQVPFPVPADFIGKAEAKADQYIAAIAKAVSKFGAYASVDFGSDAVHETIDRFGGWQAICHWGQKEWAINEGRFKTALESALEWNDRPSTYHLCGIVEQTNGDLKHARFYRISIDHKGGAIATSDKPKLIESEIKSHENENKKLVNNLIASIGRTI